MVLAAILVVAALMLVNALYVAAEFAAVSVRRSRLQQLAADGNPLAAWLLPIVESPAALDRYIAACQIGITLSSLVLGAYAQATIAVWLAPYFAALGGLQDVVAQSTSTVVVLLVLTVAQVVFAELVPKSARAAVPDADVALHAHSDDRVAVDLPPVHHVAERIRPPPPSTARRPASDPSPHPLARRDRAADRREPRRRSARAGRAPAAAARAAAESAAGHAADGAAPQDLGARHRHAAQRGHEHRRAEPVLAAAGLSRLASTTSSASCTRRIWCAGSSRGGPARRSPS